MSPPIVFLNGFELMVTEQNLSAPARLTPLERYQRDLQRPDFVADPAQKAAYGEEVEPPEPFHLFRTELTEVVRTYVEDDKYLVLQIWKPGEPVRVIKRT